MLHKIARLTSSYDAGAAQDLQKLYDLDGIIRRLATHLIIDTVCLGSPHDLFQPKAGRTVDFCSFSRLNQIS